MEICIINVKTDFYKRIVNYLQIGNGLTGAVFKRPILLFLLAELNGFRLYGCILLEGPVKLPSCVRCSPSSEPARDFIPEITEDLAGSLPCRESPYCLYCEYDILDCYWNLLHYDFFAKSQLTVSIFLNFVETLLRVLRANSLYIIMEMCSTTFGPNIFV